MYVLKIKIEAIARNKNDNRFTIFLFFLEAMVDCSLKETDRVIPAKKMKPRPKIRILCGSMKSYLLKKTLNTVFRCHAYDCQYGFETFDGFISKELS